MRRSNQEAAATRRRIVEVGASELRRRGIIETGLSELMGAAGLTRGGFYRHFASKDRFVAEACASALQASNQAMRARAARRSGAKGVGDLVSAYLSTAHRDGAASGCALAALGSELARTDTETRVAATNGFREMVAIIAEHLRDARVGRPQEQALAIASALVGALTMARVVNDPSLSEAVLRGAHDFIAEALRNLVKDQPCLAGAGRNRRSESSSRKRNTPSTL